MYKLNDALIYFMMNDWNFQDDNLVNMYHSLSTTDRIIFNCEIKELSWRNHFIIMGLGIRKYIIKDGLKHTVYGAKKMKILHALHYVITPLYLYSLWKVFTLCYFILSVVFSFLLSFVTYF